MLARLSLKAQFLVSAMVLAAGLTFGLSQPGLAQIQEGDEALIDTVTDPAIAEFVTVDAPGTGIAPPAHLPAAISLRIKYDEGASAGGNADARLLDISNFYGERRYQPIWIGKNGANPKARAVTKLLLNARDNGLDPADYDAATVAALIKTRSAQALAALEIRLSRAVLDYGRDLVVGRATPGSANSTAARAHKGPDAAVLLSGIVLSNDVRAYLGALAPRSDAGHGLKMTIAASGNASIYGGKPDCPLATF
ncbi:hypothetical protein MNBD_ALPHA09-826 [hydrothermal vent metagenome]|uniref:L,D-transpeptidase scaffold domain-containing protein n=1 Tax=hydrothermal vent metagenome TaxID=652676 RepID=A0A3B0TFG5_9ZZZZ